MTMRQMQKKARTLIKLAETMGGEDVSGNEGEVEVVFQSREAAQRYLDSVGAGAWIDEDATEEDGETMVKIDLMEGE